ncbi:DUF4136 domain-containing protein [Thalassotalea atypica]|uniref:DUF4136 domain-containing protein n=1 Tax=Thalassotalea atypica TaxID=2054316 RepID=UPI0025748E20|nr:DUF4136 domain-containing protein [Thalassotalea atypica]
MKKLIQCLALIPFILITGCVQVDSAQHSRASQLAISSVRDLPIKYPSGAKFSLSPRYSEQLSITEAQMQQAYDVYATQIIQSLESKGYQYTTESNPHFYVGYGIALGKDLSDQAINQKFGVLPGLPSVDDLEKGSFLIYIEDSAMEKQVWRGAIQGFVHEDYSEQEREQRAAYIVNAVLRQFYLTK